MRVLIAGQGRAGSTVLWRMATKLLHLNGIKAAAGWDRPRAWKSKAYVLKVHPFDKVALDWADVVLTPRRDIREAVDSYERIIPRRIVNEKKVRDCCKEMTTLYNMWKDHSDYEMVYERFREDPEKIVAEIAAAMGFECPEGHVKQVLKHVGRPPGKKPMILKRTWVEDIIEKEYHGWLAEHGYPVPGQYRYRGG